MSTRLADSSVLASWTTTLVRALEERGIDVDALLREAEVGIDVTSLGPEQRIPQSASNRLWAAAVDVIGDDAFGIEVSRHARPGSFHGLGHGFMASPTLRSALERAARFSRVTADLARCEVRTDDDTVAFVIGWRPDSLIEPSAPALDTTMAVLVRAARVLLDARVAPQRLELCRPEPQNLARFEGFFRCPLTFGAPENVLAFHEDDATRAVPAGHERLAVLGDHAVASYLGELDTVPTTADRVREVLEDVLGMAGADVGTVASELAMSRRTLQRRLEDEGTSFRAVLAAVRKDMAQRLLADGMSVTAVAGRLGFSETAAFSRAFTRWTGSSPSAFRPASGPHRIDASERRTIASTTPAMSSPASSLGWVGPPTGSRRP